MNINKKLLFCCFALIFVFIISGNVNAHSGRTASDGCHYCRTNCDSYGVAWNQRHCHNTPTPISKPKPKPPVITESESNPEPIKIDNPKQESQSAYTAQIQDKADKSNGLIYWMFGIVLIIGVGWAWTRKKQK